jgi:hypothetical protein
MIAHFTAGVARIRPDFVPGPRPRPFIHDDDLSMCGRGMTRARNQILGLTVLCALACTEPNPAYWMVSSPDAGEPEPPPAGQDAAAPAPDTRAPDRGPPAAPDLAAPADLVLAADLAAPDASVTPAGCGSGIVDVSGIMNVDGLVIDDDGTIYLLTDDANNSYVGRILPGQGFQQKWQPVMNAPVTWGLGLDRARHRIYVLVVATSGSLVAIDNITTTPTARTAATGLNNANDVVVAPDGTVYYSSQGDRHIYRVGPAGGAPVKVSTSTLGSTAQEQLPSALALAGNGDLIVGLDHGGPLYRLGLVNGLEQSRTTVGTWSGWANGLAFDLRGRLYVGIYDDTQPRTVVRLEPSGPPTVLLSGGRYSSIAFGRGALDCRDLYVTDPFGPMHRVHVDDVY